MKISEITLENVKQSARIDYDWDDFLIEQVMDAAKSYLCNATDMTVEELDELAEMSIAFYQLCADMYDNRSAISDNVKDNPTTQRIIAMHRRNYL